MCAAPGSTVAGVRLPLSAGAAGVAGGADCAAQEAASCACDNCACSADFSDVVVASAKRSSSRFASCSLILRMARSLVELSSSRSAVIAADSVLDGAVTAPFEELTAPLAAGLEGALPSWRCSSLVRLDAAAGAARDCVGGLDKEVASTTGSAELCERGAACALVRAELGTLGALVRALAGAFPPLALWLCPAPLGSSNPMSNLETFSPSACACSLASSAASRSAFVWSATHEGRGSIAPRRPPWQRPSTVCLLTLY
eukprot:scaffold25405_cov33-Tisochrysis_lutea.AAC.4